MNCTTDTVQTSTPTNDAVSTTVNLVATNMDKQNLVPQKFEGFVSWGHHNTIKQIVKSGLFYPVFVTGLSGNGKTLMIEQIHAEMKKELIRVNITIETDEDDLLGGFDSSMVKQSLFLNQLLRQWKEVVLYFLTNVT